MISYLGMPVLLPDGTPFGTLCVLDGGENHYSETATRLLAELRGLIEGHLALVHMNHALGNKDRGLTDYVDEIRTLRGIIPICSHCKDVRTDEGYWQAVEQFVTALAEATFSHGICPTCVEIHYADVLAGP